ncbi:DUF6095 family protein [Psychroserpens sp. XS_ASV72]|uniref:DUF6095 family protein n=1 Tax=Psychroserpens sp. XS_ASV72 TaxID=3241293 RepID=UPI0035197AD5
MSSEKRTNKPLLIKGIKIMGLSLACMFIGPTLFYVAQTNNEKLLYIPLMIIAITVCVLAVFFAFKGLRTIMNSMFDN